MEERGEDKEESVQRTNATYLVRDQSRESSLPPLMKVVFLVASSALFALISPPYLPLTISPLMFGLVSNEKKNNQNPQYLAACLYGIILCVYHTLLFGLLMSLVFGDFFFIPVPFLILSVYSSFIYVICRQSMDHHNFFGKVLITLLWDPPLLLTIYISNWFGQRFLHDGDGGFMSHICPDITISSLPLGSDVKSLKDSNVVGVVNMCRESRGPLAQYKEHSIEQLHLPTYDASAPSLADLQEGVLFINRMIQEKKGRVLVHCKGGRARAATMVLCFYIYKGETVEGAIEKIALKRKVTERLVASYQVVNEFAKCNSPQ